MYHEKNWFTRQAGSIVDIIYSWHKIEHVPFWISHKVLFAWKPEHFNVSAIAEIWTVRAINVTIAYRDSAH
jgi:hypothetical protein